MSLSITLTSHTSQTKGYGKLTADRCRSSSLVSKYELGKSDCEIYLVLQLTSNRRTRLYACSTFVQLKALCVRHIIKGLPKTRSIFE